MWACGGVGFSGGTVEVVRNKSAEEVAREFGRAKRAVLLWVKEPFDCPHTLGVRRGHASPYFDFEEVAGWLSSRGLPLRRAANGQSAKGPEGQIENGQRATGPHSECGNVGVWPCGNPALPFSMPDTGLGARGEVDFDALVERWKLAAHRLFGSIEEQAVAGTLPTDPNAKKQMAGAMVDISRELRQLDDKVFENQRRGREWVATAEAARIVAELSQMFVVDLQGLGADLPGKLSGVLVNAGLIPEAEGDNAARRMAVALREAVDVLRGRRAEVLARAGEDLKAKAA